MKSGREPSALGKNIRYYRLRRRGWNQRELAKAVGINWRYISRIETGLTQTMFVEQALAIARALGVTVEELMQCPGEGG